MRLLAAVIVAVGHELSFSAVPPGWHVAHVQTGCTDPVARVSVAHGDQLLVVQERLHPIAAELRRRPAHFAVHGAPSPLACCSVGAREGWVVQFGQNGRAFYAYVYPGREDPQPLLRILDSLRVD